MASGKVLSFSDPFLLQSVIRASDVEIIPTARGTFHTELTQVIMRQLWMQRFHDSLPQVYVGKLRPGRKAIGFLTDKDQSPAQNCGREFSPQEIVVHHDDVTHHRTFGDCRFGAMSLATDDYNAACKAIVGREVPVDKLARVVRPSQDLMSRLTKLHGTVGQMAKTTPEVLELPEVSRAMEQQLIHLMVRCLTEGEKISTGARRHRAIIVQFEALLEANADTPLYLTEICAAIGAPERTLRNVCEQYLGMGPIRYLALRRLHLVHRLLLQAVPGTTTITKIAHDHGFWELGRFAGAYRALFGEAPSATLQRPPNDRLMRLNRPSHFLNQGIA